MEGTPQEVLTSDLLIDKAFGISRYTSVARKAKELGLWKKNELPVTLEEAAQGFAPNPTPLREKKAHHEN